MPCPYAHFEEPDGTGEPRKPLDRVIDWYRKDINLSRRVGWEHGPPPQWIQRIYEYVNDLTLFQKGGQTDAMDMGQRFKAIMEGFSREPGLYPPADPKGEGGAERPFRAFWPPVKDPALYPPMDAKGSGGKERPYTAFWEEAFTTILDEQRFGSWMPGRKQFGQVATRDPGESEPTYKSTTGTRGTRGPTQGGTAGVLQTNWTEVVNQMTGLVGGQKARPPMGPRDPNL